jgi:flagellar hook protein FlgE
MSTFSTSLSGLDAEEQALSVISNDLANLNTTAFKTGTPVFSDLFYQMLGTDGAGDPVQLGVGATMSSVDSPFTQGSITTTGVSTDVAIQGNGLFVLEQDGTQVYTRAGNFTLNSQGNLVDSNGNNVMGYTAVNGIINTSSSLAPIVISSGQTYPPNATTNVQLDMNLDATDTSLAPATGILTAPQPLPTAGQTVSIGGTTYTFATTINAQSVANTVLIGTTVQSTLANLAGAINASSSNGQAAGTTYGVGTVANAAVTATGSTATTLSLQAINAGALGNSDPTSSTWTAGSFGGTDLTGGGNAQSATAIFTVPSGTLPTAGQTIDIGGTTYTFEDSINAQSPANTVKIGVDTVSTLANLMAAINATQADSGTAFSSTTQANGLVTATGSTSNTVTLQAASNGSGGDTLAASTLWAGGLFAVAYLSGGANGQTAGATLTVPSGTLPNAGDTVDIAGTTYTFQNSINSQSPADTVKIGVDAASTLANLMAAINATPADSGTAFSSTTQANASVTATGSTSTTVTLQASQSGAAGNSLAVSTSWSGGLFAAGALAGGADATTATGTLSVAIPLPTAGQTVTVGTTTYTFANAINAQSAANTVLIGADVPSTLANLAAAINATPADAGAAFSANTVANTSVTATGSTTTTLALQALQSGSAGNTIPTTTNWAAGSFGAGDLTGGTDAGTFSTPITVYDSLGNSHVLTFNFTKSSSGNWTYQITIPAADVGATGNPQVVGTGTLQFGPDGNLISPPADVQGISINGLTDGAKALSLNWQLFSSPGVGVLTQTAEPSATSGTKQDGYSSGTLQSYSINSSGVIDGVLSNGQTVALGQIALATFANYDGLTNLGSNDYQTSLASGAASVAAPGTGGSGTLDGGSLEASNVDIATAFTMLIQAERGYEANAKAITTADDVMQASINLIQS